VTIIGANAVVQDVGIDYKSIPFLYIKRSGRYFQLNAPFCDVYDFQLLMPVPGYGIFLMIGVGGRVSCAGKGKGTVGVQFF
jgi:hypothetical protein